MQAIKRYFKGILEDKVGHTVMHNGRTYKICRDEYGLLWPKLVTDFSVSKVREYCL